MKRTHDHPVLAALLIAAGVFLLGCTARAGSDGITPNVSAPSSVDTNKPDFWHQQYLLGDWGGTRTELANEGVTFDFNNISDFLADVTGSQTHHATLFTRFRFTTDIDFNKLAGFDGEFFFSPIWQGGPNLSGQYLHVNTLTSSIAGTNAVRIDQLWYQQGLFDHQLLIKLGQVAPVNEFGATDFFDILFNDELGYAPNAIFPTRIPFSPAGEPGVIVTGDLKSITPGLYIKGGVFTAYDDPYHPDRNGIDYGDQFNNGISAAFEVGYHEQNPDYAGVYKLGSTMGQPKGGYINPATGEHYDSDYNIYFTAEKTVYHPLTTVPADPKDMKSGREVLDTKRGLDLLFEFVGAPGDRNALQYEATFGARYTGLFDSRPEDKVGFGIIYSDNSNSSSDAYYNATERSLGGEYTFELDYQYNPTPWFSLQPDIQYIVDPGGDFQRQDILVLGLRTIVHF
jgi:porin